MDLKKTLAATVAATTLGVGGVAIVNAAGAGASSTDSLTAVAGTPSGPSSKVGDHKGRRRRMLRHAAQIAAKTIGIPPKQLVTELRTGKSVAQVATAHGVEPSKVVDAWVTAGNKRIDKALAAHKITPEQATKFKARLPKAAEKLVNHVFKAK